MSKPVIFSIDDEQKKQRVLALYKDYMKQQNEQPQFFESLEDFKNSPHYQNLSEEEKEHFQEHEGKNLIVLVFNTAEQAIEFVQQMQKKGLISEEKAEQIVSDLQENEAPRPRM
ncbi:hypothetical protein OQJ18_06690 [Fluoribacter dumoffii]|uniref:Uncharacterized protein n=1 Tax=Fluoribacter dumoffii TaxID=463 RepID=A0A377G842_9GAMM|nr:hypothetical protein [Fluoribacter dumoffii]KTC89870.1 hypothetical protein Ldum_0938 [Fluoribacter dumoffii NY 23]MCW8385168.1 hypothetical protein [Fluoribacter dumoffii]MCW8418222.1 hypothetical protein [Fluoribacter dumoffii]MCW8453936.1 hypothetical protein [Fluoribacter dumoffii]MCW8461993.1 hypothetical protein [Fluoribacter dumoffii]